MTNASKPSEEDYYYYLELCTKDMDSQPETLAMQGIIKFLYPILLFLASICNIPSMCYLLHLSVHKWSTCLYLTVLCVVDLTVLYIQCGNAWLFLVTGYSLNESIMHSSNVMCKTYLFLTNVLLHLWPWLIVAMAVELMIATRFPLKTYAMCTLERARATVLLIAILLVCLDLNYFWTWETIQKDGTKMCIYTEEISMDFLNTIWPSIEMSIKHILPFLIVTFCFTVSAVSLLCSNRKQTSAYEPVLKKYFLDLEALQQLKRIMLLLSLLFIIVKALTISYETLHMLHVRMLIDVPCVRLGRFLAWKQLAKTVRDASQYCFQSLKFVTYIAFCTSFRKQCLTTLRKLISCQSKFYARTQTKTDA